MDKEIIHKEIDLIQLCITRMANNSFLLKGWTVSLIVVVLALAEKASNSVLLGLILLIPLVSFWYLDAFFLRTEKMYRKMYEWVLNQRKNNIDDYLYDLNPHRFKGEVDSECKVMFSVTLRWFYGVPFFLIVCVIIFSLFIQKGV